MKAIYAIVGIKYRGAEDFVKYLPRGTALLLIREPDNQYDPNAIKVYVQDRHIGFIRSTQARELAQRMDAHGIVPATPPDFIDGYGQPATLVHENKWPAAEVDE